MKALKLFGFAFIMTALMVSCGEETKGGAAAGVEVSAEMKDFISGFNGTDAAVSTALKKHGATEEIKEHDMGMYGLKEPKVTAKDGDCYTLVCKSGMVENKYKVCWKEGKINSIADAQ